MARVKPTDAVAVDQTPGTPDTKEAVSLSDVESPPSTRDQVPLSFKILSVAFVAGIGFGSSWSSGVTGAMKSTLKKVKHNTQQKLTAFTDFAHSNFKSTTPNSHFSKRATIL